MILRQKKKKSLQCTIHDLQSILTRITHNFLWKNPDIFLSKVYPQAHFQTLAIFPVGCLKSHSFFLKKKRLKYVLAFKPKAAQAVLNRITRKNYTLNKYQVWKDLQPIVYLELHSLEKRPENLSIKTQKKYLKRLSVHSSDRKNENAVTSTTNLQMHMEVLSGLGLHVCLFFTDFNTICIFPDKVKDSTHHLFLSEHVVLKDASFKNSFCSRFSSFPDPRTLQCIKEAIGQKDTSLILNYLHLAFKFSIECKPIFWFTIRNFI